MRNKKIKYVIFSPNTNHGGAIALHTLCRLLSEKGFNSKLFYADRFNYDKYSHIIYWGEYLSFLFKEVLLNLKQSIRNYQNIPKIYQCCSNRGCKRKIIPIISRNTIVVYPEIVVGNPLNAKNVVRYLLYNNIRYKQFNSKTIGYGPNDLFFAYREVFNDPVLNPEGRILCTPYYDLDLYKQTNFGERKGKCYILRKGLGRSDLPKEYDGIIIDHLPESEKVRVFNESEYCISYDTQTAYSKIAALCGCISVVVPEKGKTRKDYRSGKDIDYGVAFGFSNEEIENAIATREKLHDYYIKINDNSKKDVMRFVDECERYFNLT